MAAFGESAPHLRFLYYCKEETIYPELRINMRTIIQGKNYTCICIYIFYVKLVNSVYLEKLVSNLINEHIMSKLIDGITTNINANLLMPSLRSYRCSSFRLCKSEVHVASHYLIYFKKLSSFVRDSKGEYYR